MPKKNTNTQGAADNSSHAGSRPTKYGGQLVTKEEMDAIHAAPIGKFLNFKETKDGLYRMQYQFPDQVELEGKTVYIRKAINTLAKYLAQKFIGNDYSLKEPGEIIGSVSLSKNNAEDGKYSQLQDLGIPENDQEVIADFFNTFNQVEASEKNKTYLTGNELLLSFIGQFYDVQLGMHNFVDLFHQYQNLPEEERSQNNLLETMVKGSMTDYCNTIAYLKKTAMMDPETTTEISFYMACNKFADLAKRISDVTGKTDRIYTQTIKMANMNKDPQKSTAYDSHVCLVGDFKLNGADKIVSVEMTAPPTNKCLYAPAEGRTATGVYNEVQELIDFHKSRNIIDGSEEAYAKLKSTLENNDPLESEFNVRAALDPDFGKHGIEKASKQNIQKLKDLRKTAKKEGGYLHNSPEYDGILDSLKMAEVYASLIHSCKAAGKTEISLDTVAKQSSLAAAYAKHRSNHAKTDKMISLKEAGKLFEESLVSVKAYARAYQKQKLAKHGNDVNQLSRSDRGKLAFAESLLPKAEHLLPQNNNAELQVNGNTKVNEITL